MCRSKSETPHRDNSRPRQDTQKQTGFRRNPSSREEKRKPAKTNQLELDEDNHEEEYTTFNLRSPTAPPLKVQVQIEGRNVTMEVDTGATYSVVGKKTFDNLFSEVKLQDSDITLTTYTGEPIVAEGQADIQVVYEGQEYSLPLIVAPGDTPALLGRNWMRKMRLNWNKLAEQLTLQPGVNKLSSGVERIKGKFPKLFKQEPGKLRDFKAKIEVEKDSSPKFFKARTVSYYMRSKLDAEYKRLQEQCIIEPVKYSEWASPAVPVLKRDHSVRVCGDYKITVNQSIKKEVYPLPTTDDLFTKLEGGVKFAKIDLSHAYQQIELDEDSQNLLVLNTHQGLMKYKRLNFGVATAPAIFQRTIEGVLQGARGTAVYLDDIIITGKSVKE